MSNIKVKTHQLLTMALLPTNSEHLVLGLP